MRCCVQESRYTRVGDRGTLSGWVLRERLVETNDIPMLFFFSTCTDMIGTIPIAQQDPDRPLKRGEDHCLDQLRYACMSRPFLRSTAPAEKRTAKMISMNANDCSVSLNIDAWEQGG